MKPERIVIIVGGPSAEASVSRKSGAAVAAALRDGFDAVECFELDATLTDSLQGFAPDVVVPMLHGAPGEDGTVQGYLEILGYPYVGSGVESSACALNKIIAKQLFSLAGLPVVRDRILNRDIMSQGGISHNLLQSIKRDLGAQLVVKPAAQGSALGVAQIHTDDLQKALEEAFKYDTQVLLERRIVGREITVGVLEKSAEKHPEALPVTEIVTPEHSWYDYDHRYASDGAEHLIPAPLPGSLTKALQDAALAAHKALNCRDLSRADFIVTQESSFHLLEVNTMPGMTATSLYPDAAQAAGYSLSDLMAILVDNAWRRGPG